MQETWKYAVEKGKLQAIFRVHHIPRPFVFSEKDEIKAIKMLL